jgi:hypothetical protein
MATQPKPEKVMLRQAAPIPLAPREETLEPIPQPTEPIAQWQDNRGDRLVYVIWMSCFVLLAAATLWNTLAGFLFGQ